ncbi:MAG: response regulator [Beijerinckiaceae bacterium]
MLVVDDDPAVSKSIDRVLSNKGYAVITAGSGEEALRKLNEEKYDVVYTDIRMPGLSGLEVAEQIKAQRPWTPVVIITGYGTDAAESRAKAAGVVGFLHKPLSPEMIEGSARDALAAPAAAAEAQGLPATIEAPAAEPAGIAGALKNIALFLAAPFIGLAYIVALPFVGFFVLAVMAARAESKFAAVNAIRRTLKTAGMMIAGALIGLAFVAFFPLVGLAMLAWMGGRAVLGADVQTKN